MRFPELISLLGLSCIFLSSSFSQTISSVSGTGTFGFSGDGGQAAQAAIASPSGVAFDGQGNLYFADTGNFRVRKISNGVISTVAGSGVSNSNQTVPPAGPALSTPLLAPTGVAVGGDGTVYFDDFVNEALDPNSGILTPDPNHGFTYLASDGQGNVYAASLSGGAVYLYQTGAFVPAPFPIVLAGDEAVASDDGDNGPAAKAHFLDIAGLAADAAGNVYVADDGACRVRRFPVIGQGVSAVPGTITTVLGTGSCATDPGAGDGGLGQSSQISSPSALAVDPTGNLFVNTGGRIHKVDTQGNVTAYAGSITPAPFAGDGAPALNVELNVNYMASDKNGNLFLTDGSSRIYEIMPGQTVTAKPMISGVISAATNKQGVTPKSWVSIYGSNLSGTTRQWDTPDFNGSSLPLSLDGVSVTVNGKPAAVEYISPNQVNIQAPDDNSSGTIDVILTNVGGASDPYPTTLSATDAALFVFYSGTSSYVAAQHTDYALVAPANFGTGRPAVPGETLLLYGTGFGPTNPDVPAGTLFSGAAPLSGQYPLSVTIGGVAAQVSFAGITAAGLYQLNVVVPQVSPGDQPVVAVIGSDSTQQGALLPISQ